MTLNLQEQHCNQTSDRRMINSFSGHIVDYEDSRDRKTAAVANLEEFLDRGKANSLPKWQVSTDEFAAFSTE
ncbi:hypothetical protein C7B65_18465 [Phormidesmis priestleyi ULC007]|uniref:Uncharacterized protein n=1 Tax=Phormidesmis priestleyi ULC007 TaxID=1920490 RepID=A0A2T1DAN7_9CYAN|nr:hypothetical protein [Phormidesmis priestleyi]PSB17527.1 hypothetical protein C7B65_18465 [Phormidesmis priestleyi ULC007]PZO47244.1 MAG: hypothetical protein DCF14_20285 [Phormidesmis priestleyi]